MRKYTICCIITCTLTLSACGSGISTPKCSDEDVQEALKIEMQHNFFDDNMLEALAGKSGRVVILENMAYKADKIVTQDTNESKHRVLCSAVAKSNIADDKLQDAMMKAQREAARMHFDKGEKEVVTDAEFQQYINKRYGSKAIFDNEMHAAQNGWKGLFNKTKEIEYSARRTDDGKLIVEIESR